jgi:NAD-dependent deacetylase
MAVEIRNIVILTGAGVSAESGVATFRGPDGLWEGHRVEDVCTPEAYARDPELVHAFYNARRATLATVEPNAAHVALARLDAAWPGELLLVTQNVDDLHERAGSKRLLLRQHEAPGVWPATSASAGKGPMGDNQGVRCSIGQVHPTSSGSARCVRDGPDRDAAPTGLFVSRWDHQALFIPLQAFQNHP